MTIEIIDGCLLSAFEKGEVNVIGHVVNCKHKMNSGIARSIREKYPKVYDFYMETNCTLGLCRSIGLCGDTCRIVCNLYAQDNYGYDGKRYLNYAALSESLRLMAKNLTGSEVVVGFPYNMGSDRAGGDWDIVLEMIDFHFRDFHQVKIYRLNK